MLRVKHLTMGQQQILEILKAISTNPKVLIMDEPTSSLTEAETSELFGNIGALRAQGISFIYITHKLGEVFRLADRVLVMRDGKKVQFRPVSEVTEQHLVSMMVGRGITDMYGALEAPAQVAEEYFAVEGLTRQGAFRDVTFRLRRGEILGLAGLVGAGRTEVARAIFGLERLDEGRVMLEGRPADISNPRQAIGLGIAYLTEDRKAQGLFLEMAIADNLIAPRLESYSNRLGMIDHPRVARTAGELMLDYDIAAPSIHQEVLTLSGGNQQKCMVAMWMGIQPKVVMFDEPTRGVDVGARSEIYHKLREFARQGTGVIMISSDLTELIGMCDRILVMHQGQITGEVAKPHFSEELILAYAAGILNHQTPDPLGERAQA
jgi:ABC-type sugar transport system ATPase subunit